AHEMTHTKRGGWCPGGKYHRLGDDYVKGPVRELEGGMAAHFDRIMATDPALLTGFAAPVGPIPRPRDYEVESWKRTWLPREAEIAAHRSAEPLGDEDLDRWFPKSTANHNCLAFAKFDGGVMRGGCPALSLCWGGEAPEAFAPRVANHKEE